MGIIDTAIDAFRFKETIFYKTTNNLQNKYEALKQLNVEYPDNDDIQKELNIIKKGLDGEDEIAYQLKKASIGMYVLRDINIKHNDLTAQIDYVIITPIYTYYVECKNLTGNITVTEKGDFIKETYFNGKKEKKGMYSPLRQVEAQREVIRKIWEENTNPLRKFFASSHFNHYRRVLVVVANQDTILNTDKAPSDIKYKIIRADALVRQLKYDFEHRDKDDYVFSKKEMEEIANYYLNLSTNEYTNYFIYYKNKFCNVTTSNLKGKLVEFRKNRANEKNIPAYYVFNNEELDKIVELKPRTIEELTNSKILSDIKLNNHGKAIVELINKED